MGHNKSNNLLVKSIYVISIFARLLINKVFIIAIRTSNNQLSKARSQKKGSKCIEKKRQSDKAINSRCGKIDDR